MTTFFFLWLSYRRVQPCTCHTRTHKQTHTTAFIFPLLLLLPCLWYPWQHIPAARRWHSCPFPQPTILLIKAVHLAQRYHSEGQSSLPQQEMDMFPSGRIKGNWVENLHFDNKQNNPLSSMAKEQRNPSPWLCPHKAFPSMATGEASSGLQPLWHLWLREVS